MMRSIPASLFAPEMSLKDLMDNVKGGLFSLGVFASDLNTFDARKTGLSYGVPMYFLLGDLDYVTPVPLVQAFVQEISAPHKEVIILEGAGHNAILTDPDRFLAMLVDRLGIRGRKGQSMSVRRMGTGDSATEAAGLKSRDSHDRKVGT